jgi:methionine synthase II (cobalamin-independent)
MVRVRDEEVLLPATIVGSYPRPLFLRGKVFPLTGVNSPEFPDFETRALYRNAVALAIKDMTDAGLDIVTDGCQHYESSSDYEQGEIFHFYLDRLEGFVPYGDNLTAGAFQDIPMYKPTCVGPIGWQRPIFKPVVEATVQQTDKPVKIQAAVGPATMSALITDKHYGDLKALSLDLAHALNAELRDIVSRGVGIVQFAEVLTFLDPAAWVIEAINAAFDGVDAYKVIHICYRQQEAQPGVTELRGAKLFPWLWDLNCDQIQYEMASHGFHDSDIQAISTIPAGMDFGVGVINGKNLNVETPQWIADGIRKVLTVIPPERVGVYTDCTLTGLKHIVAKRKIESLVAGTKSWSAPNLPDRTNHPRAGHRPDQEPLDHRHRPRPLAPGRPHSLDRPDRPIGVAGRHPPAPGTRAWPVRRAEHPRRMTIRGAARTSWPLIRLPSLLDDMHRRVGVSV